METQIKSFYKTGQGIKFVTIFGYATKGVPSLEINGAGKLSRNIKEKIIYLTRIRKLSIPLRRFVICVDLNELGEAKSQDLKWLEFPLLLLYWYLSGNIPISKLDDCLCSGWIKTNGEIFQMSPPTNLGELIKSYLNPVERQSIKLISLYKDQESDVRVIDTSLLLEHVKGLKFRFDYMERSSAIPTNSNIA